MTPNVETTTSLPDMIYIWRGDLPLEQALASGRLDAHGPQHLRRALRAWLGVSVLAPHRVSAR
jgi:hypothetical protein